MSKGALATTEIYYLLQKIPIINSENFFNAPAFINFFSSFAKITSVDTDRLAVSLLIKYFPATFFIVLLYVKY